MANIINQIQNYHKTLTQYYHQAGVQAYRNPNWKMPQEMRDEIAHYEKRVRELQKHYCETELEEA